MFGKSLTGAEHLPAPSRCSGEPVDTSSSVSQRNRGGARLCHRGPEKSLGLVLGDETIHAQHYAGQTCHKSRAGRNPERGPRKPRWRNSIAPTLDIRAHRACFSSVVNLSGGNQQKVVLSKWLIVGAPEVLILGRTDAGHRRRRQI